MGADPIVIDYLDRLETAAAALPEDRRVDLLTDVREHIEVALAEAGAGDEATVRAVLVRLGSPEEIVAAEIAAETLATGRTEPAVGPAVRRRPRATVEFKALMLLTAGAIALPFIGPLIGLGYVWSSDRWTTIQKRTASLGVVGLLLFPAVILLPMLAGGEITAIFSTFGPLVALVPLAGLLPAAYLLAVLFLELSVVARQDG